MISFFILLAGLAYDQLPMSETTSDTGDGTHGSITSRVSQESANGSENINSRSYQVSSC